MLEICRQIRREAFHVLYGENEFLVTWTGIGDSILEHRPVCDAITQRYLGGKISMAMARTMDLNPLHTHSWITCSRSRNF